MAKVVINNTDAPKDSRVVINNNFTELYEGANINAATDKATPVDADLFGIWDSVASTLKKLTWANLKATLKIYFDTLYPPQNGWIPVSASWAYASADAPTFTITVPSGAASLYSVGMRIKLTQTTVKYFIITAVADTVLTVYGGTDYTLVNAAISAISYSTQKAPLGFPLSPIKWSVTASISASGANPTQNAWNNRGNIVLPIGVWNTAFSARHFSVRAANGYCTTNTTLSTTNNGESDASMSSGINYAFTITEFACSFVKQKLLAVTSKTTYYLNQMTDVTGITNLGITNGEIIAVCAYL